MNNFNPSPFNQRDGDSTPPNKAVVKLANTLVTEPFDYVSLSQTSDTDVYTFKSGGSGGTTVATITVTFTDSTKETLSSVART